MGIQLSFNQLNQLQISLYLIIDLSPQDYKAANRSVVAFRALEAAKVSQIFMGMHFTDLFV
jgi:hypothetical protein